MGRFVFATCFNVPTDFSTVTCANITDYGPLIQYFHRNHWKGVRKGQLCKTSCLNAIQKVDLSLDVVSHNDTYYTPGIYADGYIVFAFPFVRSLVRLFVRSLVC